MSFSCANWSVGAQNPPSLSKLIDAEYILLISHEGTFEFTLQLNSGSPALGHLLKQTL